MFRQPTLTTNKDQQKKAKVKKEVSLPILIPEQLYSAIRLTCVVHALDEGNANRLNEHDRPMIKVHEIKGKKATTRMVLYSADLLKSWLKFMMTFHIWCAKVEVPKVVKSRFGSVTSTGNDTVHMNTLRLPTDAEIESSYNANAEFIEIMKGTRDVVAGILLCGGDLKTIRDLPIGDLPDPDSITTPNNICKVSRLDMLNMSKCGLTQLEKARWIEFYKAEKVRIAYVNSAVDSTRVPDKVLNGMDDSSTEEYNRKVVEDATKRFENFKVNTNVFDGAMDVRSKGRVVNPALVQLYDVVAKGKSLKDEEDRESRPKELYKAMCAKYYNLTGKRLDAKKERVNGTYDLRMGDIKWAEELRVSRPTYHFIHYEATDRIRAVEGLLSEKAVEMGTVTTTSNKVAPTATQDQSKPNKAFGTFKHGFTQSNLYSKSNPKSVVIPNAAIHSLMNKQTVATKPQTVQQQQQQQPASDQYDNDVDDGYYSEESDDEAQDDDDEAKGSDLIDNRPSAHANPQQDAQLGSDGAAGKSGEPSMFD